jgi:tight adherence protein C
MQTAIVAILALGCIVLLVTLWQRMHLRQRSLDRFFAGDHVRGEGGVWIEQKDWLNRWLSLAGFRSPDAVAWFITATFVSVLAGGLMLYGVYSIGMVAIAVQMFEKIPGGVGEVFIPVAHVIPWLGFLGIAALPIYAVVRTRRLRVQQIEIDLPLALELLATLSEAGLGFDAALARILESGLADRALSRELRSFQADLVAGRTRVEAMRRLARRVEVSTVSILVSALVQAEQLGTGIAMVLRRQADDLRQRRRERANAFAASLAIKRMFPMVICFLPALFVWTLGPTFTQLFLMADSMLRARGL